MALQIIHEARRMLWDYAPWLISSESNSASHGTNVHTHNFLICKLLSDVTIRGALWVLIAMNSGYGVVDFMLRKMMNETSFEIPDKNHNTLPHKQDTNLKTIFEKETVRISVHLDCHGRGWRVVLSTHWVGGITRPCCSVEKRVFVKWMWLKSVVSLGRHDLLVGL